MAQPQVSAVGSVNDGGQGGGGAAASGGGNADSSQAAESQQQQTTSGAPRGGALGVGARPENKFASSSLYVGDLSKDVTEATLFELFNAVGPVASIRVCRDGATRQSLGYAYVNFHSTKDAERALDTMNFANIKGKQCRIMWSQRDPSLRRSNRGNVFVKCLHESIDNKTLYDTFSVFGNILSCKVATNEDGSSRQYGYVHYADEASAQKAIEGVNGMSINNKVVEACAFQPRTQREKNISFTNVYVKYIPRHCDEAMCKEAFTKLVSDELKVDAEITHSKFWVQPFGVSGCFNFKTHEQAKAAVEILNQFDLRTIYPEPSDDVVTDNAKGDDEKGDEKDDAAVNTKAEDGDNTDADGDKAKTEEQSGTTDAAAAAAAASGDKNDNDKAEDGTEEKAAIVGVVAGNKDAPKKAEHKLLFATRAEKRKTRDFLLARQKGRGGYSSRGGRGGMRGGPTRYYLGGNLYVKHLKPDVDDEKLKEMFASFGEIQSAKVMKDEQNNSRQFGFVAFKTKDAATRALHEMNMKQQGTAKPLYVSRAQSRQARINRKLSYMNRRGRGGGGAPYNMYQGPFSNPRGSGGASGYNPNYARTNYTPSGGIYGMQQNPLQGQPMQQQMQQNIGGNVGVGPNVGMQNIALQGLQQQQQLGRNIMNQQNLGNQRMLPQYGGMPQVGNPMNPLMNQQFINRGAGMPGAQSNLNATLQQLFPFQNIPATNMNINQQRGGLTGVQQGIQGANFPTNFSAQQTSQTNQIRNVGNVGLQNVQALQSTGTAGLGTNAPSSQQMPFGQQSVPRTGAYSVQSGGVGQQSQLQSQPTNASVPQGGQSASVMSAGGRDSAAMKESHPLTQQMLSRISTPAEKKRLIGERLFPKIQVVEPRLAGKITGMLLEMDNKVLLQLLSDNAALHAKINEALAVLQEHHKSQQNASNANRASSSNAPQ